MIDKYAYVPYLAARIEEFCREEHLVMPMMARHDAADPRVSADAIYLPPLMADCRADHKVFAWEIAQVWRGCMMARSPWAVQRELAHYQIDLDEEG